MGVRRLSDILPLVRHYPLDRIPSACIQIMDGDVIQNFRDAVRKSQHIVVVAGAGLSAASGRCSTMEKPLRHVRLIVYMTGIPTFRDGGGMWRALDVTSLATPTAFELDPSLVWQFYHYRRVKFVQIGLFYVHSLIWYTQSTSSPTQRGPHVAR